MPERLWFSHLQQWSQSGAILLDASVETRLLLLLPPRKRRLRDFHAKLLRG
jgi:hypothetical protein